MKNYASVLIEFSSDAAFVINGNRRVTAWNDLAQKLLGYTSKEAVGENCSNILQATLTGGEPMCHSDCDVFNCFQVCRPTSVPSCLLQHKNGDWIPAGISSITLPQQTGLRRTHQDIAIIFLRDATSSSKVLARQTLQIFTLGGFGIVLAGHSIDFGKWKRKQALTLLKILVTQLDRSVHRERLIDSIWPDVDEKQGWGRLKVTMYYLRRELRAHGMSDDVIKTIGSAYMLRRDAVWIDAEAFERLFEQGRKLQEKAKWDEALMLYVEAGHLYRGDYLEEEAFEDWCAEERERLCELNLDLLARTAECYARLGKYTEAIHTCRKALVFDHCRENFHYALMEFLISDNHPNLALLQYRSCEQILDKELGTAPLPKTQRLNRQIIEGVKSNPSIESKFG